MDTLTAFAMGQANRGKEMMVFDWHRAAEILRERSASYASAGLAGDMEWTGGAILADGKPVPREETYTYLSSTWATPILVVDGDEVPCFRMESEVPDWGSGTYWPDSALKILTGDG